MEYLVWVGPRDTDIKYCNCFSESICYYSKSNETTIRKAHIYGDFFINFISSKMKYILSKHSEAKFIFYNPKIAYSLEDDLKKHAICLNSKYLLELLGDKIYTRYWLGAYVPVLPALLLDSHNLAFINLEEKLGKFDSYVIQKNKSSGGFGTYYLANNNHELLNELQTNFNELFIISPYIKNSIPININAIVYETDICLFSPSLQIVNNNNNRLLYHGADYCTAQMLTDEIHKKIREYSTVILNLIQKLGYRGIIGIDFIIEGSTVYFQEINPRYQASSFLIDTALSERNLPSLTKMNIDAFYINPKSNIDTYYIPINKSFYKYLYSNNKYHFYHIEAVAKKNEYVQDICLDGWDNTMQMEEDAYCYSIIFNTNITSLNLDNGYNLYPNITGEEEYFYQNMNTQIGLKIALINQGCVIQKEVLEYLEKNGTLKEATFSAIDFQLSNGIYINAPVNLKFTDFSPFNIQLNSNNCLELNHYNNLISTITVEMEPKWNQRLTKNGIPYKKIAYLSTDRLRIKHEAMCEFKRKGQGCTFCSIPATKIDFNSEDLQEIIEQLVPNPAFRHILIGGGSGNIEQECQHIIKISQLIQKKNSQIPIYLMSIPPSDEKTLEAYKESGITEIAFNIEIWNRELAKKIMPGKAQISLNTYLKMLKAGTKLWGTNGNVRSALIVGLNDTETLLQGIKMLCENGIQPMLSVFRPMPKTKLASLVPPSNSTLLSIYNRAQNICHEYELKLGPICDACKNNMLAL